MQNLIQTVLSQYGNSPILLSMLSSLNSAVDPALEITNFYNQVWNVQTAVGWGLDVWGRIVGISRNLTIPAAGTFMGFEEAVPAVAQPFNQAQFYVGAGATATYALTDDAFRLLILTKALSNISNGSIPSYNAMLRQLFPGRGNAYVVITAPMSIQLTFLFVLQPFELAILTQSGALAPPTGATFTISSY